MDDIEQQADLLATDEYRKGGYYGGKKPHGSNSIKYFDFEASKREHIEQLKKVQTK